MVINRPKPNSPTLFGDPRRYIGRLAHGISTRAPTSLASQPGSCTLKLLNIAAAQRSSAAIFFDFFLDLKMKPAPPRDRTEVTTRN